MKETAQTLFTSLQNLHELLKNLFTWSGIQRGSASYHPQAVQLHDIVERNTSFFIPVAEEKQIRLVTDVPAEMSVYADPDMLYAILRNLLSNAMKFSFPGDTVTVSTTQVNDDIEIVIVDTGVGISEGDFAKLFREDVTFQRPGTHGEEGTGLGLILCKQLVEQHGGRIVFESTLREGNKHGAKWDELTLIESDKIVARRDELMSISRLESDEDTILARDFWDRGD